MSNKNAIVISGGGSRGAFTIGALKYLIIEQHQHFDIICGVSVGAINAAFLAQYTDQVEGILALEEMWLGITTKKIYKRWFPFGRFHALWKKSLYNSKPLRDLIDANIDVEKIRSSGAILQVGSVCMDTSLYRCADQDSPNLLNIIKASCAVPLILEPVSIEHGKLDVDGGIRNNAPIADAIRMGAENITILCADHLSLKEVNTKKFHALDIAKRGIDIMADEVINNDIDMFLATNNKVLMCQHYIPAEYHELIIGSKRYIPNLIVKPSKSNNDSTIFDPKEIRQMIDDGYNTAKAMFENKQIK